MRREQVDYLTRLEFTIMKERSSQNKKERITKNTIIRAAIDTIRSLEIDISEIPDEQTLLAVIKSAIKEKAVKY